MITNALPDIPRSYTAICEWAACVVYIAVLFRRVPPRRSVVVSAIGLAALIAVQYFDGSMPIWFWIIGMLLAFACMYATILLDVILTAKERACADRGITFTAVADGSLLSGMSSMDIASLFGNALDNAINATMELNDPSKRVINVRFSSQGNLMLIQIQNYHQRRLRFRNGLPITTHQDATRHGFGMKSMLHTVEQYGGTMQVDDTDSVFTLRILLPKNPESSTG